jgi:hypothetical protein
MLEESIPASVVDASWEHTISLILAFLGASAQRLFSLGRTYRSSQTLLHGRPEHAAQDQRSRRKHLKFGGDLTR